MRFSEPVSYRLGQMTKDYKWWNGNGSSSYKVPLQKRSPVFFFQSLKLGLVLDGNF